MAKYKFYLQIQPCIILKLFYYYFVKYYDICCNNNIFNFVQLNSQSVIIDKSMRASAQL